VRVVAYDPSMLTGEDTSDSLFSIKETTGVNDSEDDDGDDIPVFVNRLEQNYPNPFNGTTTIAYSVAERCEVEISIYDTAGRLVSVIERGSREPGRHTVTWRGRDGDGRGVSSGVYFARITAGKFRQTRKMVYLR
jgi:hypothetical protein